MTTGVELPDTLTKMRMERLPDHMREEWLFEDEAARLSDDEACQLWKQTVQEVRDLTRFINLSRTVIVVPFMTGDFDKLREIRAVAVQFSRKRRCALLTMSVLSARKPRRTSASIQAECANSTNNPHMEGPSYGDHS